MSKRPSGVDVAGALLGLVAIGVTAFALLSILGRGPAALPWRGSGIVEDIGGALGRGLSEGARAVQPMRGTLGAWQTAEGGETVTGSQTALTVNNVSGSVTVSATDGEAVRVSWVKQARTAKDLDDFRIEVLTKGDAVTVRPVYEPAGGMGRFGAVDFEIQVPRRIARVELHTVSGAVEVAALPGTVARVLTTVSGAITAAGAGDLTAKTTSGAVEFAFDGDALKASTVSGRIRGTVARLGASGADLGTISGSVELGVFAALSAELDLRSVSGSIACEFPVTIREQSRGKLRGAVGGGAVPFSVSTTSGSIRIRKE